jgi:hypothetical protein
MSQHLTDIACLEWVRHRAITLAPETTSGAEIHLAGCADCRKKVADFEVLERSFHPYGTALPVPRALQIGKALKIAAIILGIGAVAWLAV